MILTITDGHNCTTGDLRNDTGGAARPFAFRVRNSCIVDQLLQLDCNTITRSLTDQSAGVAVAACNMGGTVNGAIAHCGIALNLADQCADSLYAENIGTDQVDIFDRGAFTYIAEQADVASGGDLQPGDFVPVAIKGAFKQLRLSVTNGCPGVLRKLNTLINTIVSPLKSVPLFTIAAKVFRSSALVM